MTSDADAISVPDTLDELLSPDWLTAAFQRSYPGVVVRSATLGPVVSRMSTNARFHIEYEGAPGLTADLCVKGYFGEEQAASRRVGEQEAFFYRDLAERTQVRTLKVVWAEVDPATHHGVVISEDVTAQGATFLDSLSVFTPDQTAASLEQYATLHGRTWAAPDLATRDWLSNRSAALLEVRGLPEIAGNFEGPIGAGVPDSVRDSERLLRVARSLRPGLSAAEPWCLIHGDAHIGNWFLDAEARPNMLDWQSVSRSPWYLDIGYHIASALTVEDRRRSERDLLTHYLDALRRHGGEPPSWDEAWRALRIGIIYGFYLWAITLKVAPPITSELLTRLGTATEDHDAYAVAQEI